MTPGSSLIQILFKILSIIQIFVSSSFNFILTPYLRAFQDVSIFYHTDT